MAHRWTGEGAACQRRRSADTSPRATLFLRAATMLSACVCMCVCDAEMAQFDYDYEQTTDGRYDLRPYGPYLPTRYRRRYNVAVITELQMTSLVTLLMLQRAVRCSVAQP